MAEEDVSKDDYAKLKKHYEDELKRKDELIDQLREENVLMLKTALKQSEHVVEYEKRLNALVKTKKHNT